MRRRLVSTESLGLMISLSGTLLVWGFLGNRCIIVSTFSMADWSSSVGSVLIFERDVEYALDTVGFVDVIRSRGCGSKGVGVGTPPSCGDDIGCGDWCWRLGNIVGFGFIDAQNAITSHTQKNGYDCCKRCRWKVWREGGEEMCVWYCANRNWCAIQNEHSNTRTHTDTHTDTQTHTQTHTDTHTERVLFLLRLFPILLPIRQTGWGFGHQTAATFGTRQRCWKVWGTYWTDPSQGCSSCTQVHERCPNPTQSMTGGRSNG
jgi:hypothetical protein